VRLLDVGEGIRNLAMHRNIEGVEPFRPVQRDPEYAGRFGKENFVHSKNRTRYCGDGSARSRSR
jgi:hypothetical protein